MSTYKEICTHSNFFIGGQNYILWGFFKPRLHLAVTIQWATLWWSILALRKKWLFADVSPTEINLSHLFQPPLNIYTKQGDSSYDNCLWQRHSPSVWQETNSLWGRFLLNCFPHWGNQRFHPACVNWLIYRLMWIHLLSLASSPLRTQIHAVIFPVVEWTTVANSSIKVLETGFFYPI